MATKVTITEMEIPNCDYNPTSALILEQQMAKAQPEIAIIAVCEADAKKVLQIHTGMDPKKLDYDHGCWYYTDPGNYDEHIISLITQDFPNAIAGASDVMRFTPNMSKAQQIQVRDFLNMYWM